jgi:hypothetical protein
MHFNYVPCLHPESQHCWIYVLDSALRCKNDWIAHCMYFSLQYSKCWPGHFLLDPKWGGRPANVNTGKVLLLWAITGFPVWWTATFSWREILFWLAVSHQSPSQAIITNWQPWGCVGDGINSELWPCGVHWSFGNIQSVYDCIDDSINSVQESDIWVMKLEHSAVIWPKVAHRWLLVGSRCSYCNLKIELGSLLPWQPKCNSDMYHIAHISQINMLQFRHRHVQMVNIVSGCGDNCHSAWWTLNV